MKHGILRELNKRNCDVVVVPYHTTADEILQLRPDGIMLSNGPGDPKDVPEAIHMIKQVLGHSTVIWNLSWTSIIRLSIRCQYNQNEIWSSWFKPPC